MKLLLSALCAIFLGVTVIGSPLTIDKQDRLVGAKQCTWGPSYWCSNLVNAKGCHAVRHCIQTVWEKQTVPEDNDSICQICLDMVKQARDQLESNQTQEDLKSVFEGSCKLIPLKPIQKECCKLADDFIPELVEALASQMNPQVVCSVAGLCNNAAIDQMLLEAETLTTTVETSIDTTSKPKLVPTENKLTCSGCNSVASLIADKFHSADPDSILESMMHVCGKLSSFSDSCSSIILVYFKEIQKSLENTLSADSICHLSGVCSAKYHQHESDIEIRPMSNVGVVPVKDDIPCELCEQLVRHLRDLLVANTTETEFKHVLEGLCKQTNKFQSECLSIVDQYYDVIYQDLVHNLDANGACFMIGICPKGLNEANYEILPIKPFLPVLTPAEIHVTIKEKEPVRKLLGAHEPKYTQEEIENMQLPIDRLVGAPNAYELVDNGEMCTLCEYFLHFVQEALATPSNADKIKHIVETTCDRLPKSIEVECHNFVSMYGDAVIALLIQGIDPRECCPKLKMCSANVKDSEVFSPKPVVSNNSGDKPTCPLCLLAVKQLQDVIRSDKSKDNIKHALDNLCNHLPKKLESECVDFVESYSSELIEMLITDFNPQQICVYLQLCTDKDESNGMDVNEASEDIMTNAIEDDTVNGQHISVVDQEYTTTPQCLLCQRVIKEVEKEVVNKKSKEQIKHALEHVCEKLKKLKNKCHSFVEKHGDQIVDLIMKEVAPKEICRTLGLCSVQTIDDLDIDEAIKISVIAIPAKQFYPSSEGLIEMEDVSNIGSLRDTPCVICEFIMIQLEKELKDKKTQDEIKHTVLNICSKMPKTVSKNCLDFVNKYADLVIALIDTVPPKEICTKINLCESFSFEITDEVVECGVCHGAAIAVKEAIKAPEFDGNTDMITDKGCNSLPGQYYEKCAELLKVYGQSIVNLLKGGTDASKICPRIGMCFAEESSSFEFVKINSKTS